MRVEGHADSRQISAYRYPSNWELSGARASSTIRYLVESADIDQERFISVGHGETRPIAPNDSPENWAKNRRDRKSTRLNSSHVAISYAVFCLKKKTINKSSYVHHT